MRCTALALVFAHAFAAQRGELHRMAVTFNACSKKGSDINVVAFLDATEAYCKLLSKWGKFVGPSVGNVRGCIQKVQTARRALNKETKTKLASLHDLLTCEKPIHKPNAVLADPSAAMGILWIRRGLEYWADVFEQQVEQLKKKQTSTSLAEQMAIAYKRTTQQFHGWVSRRAFSAALGMTPDWSVVRKRAGLPETDEALRKELKELAVACRELCERLRKLQVSLELEDMRRSV